MRPIRTIAVFPTMFTLGNLVCGFFAIVIASRVERPLSLSIDLNDPAFVRNIMLSGLLIFLAMIFDALDGYVARLSRTSSDFGAQLDSLCDMVTFGVAPAFLLVKMCPQFAYIHRQAVWVIAAAYVACAALRLARFNVETTSEDEHMVFTGLPSPAAAATIASFAIMFHTLRDNDNPLVYAEQIDKVLQTVLPFFAILVALLMVSRIPYPHVVNQLFRGQRSFGHVVGVIFLLAAIAVIWPPTYSVPVIFGLFALYGPVRYAWERLVRRRHQEESIF